MAEGTHRFGMAGYDSQTYGDAFADVYDDWYADLADNDFVATVVAAVPVGPAHILDLGTGTGRLLERVTTSRSPEQRAHDRLVGIDSSEAMLAVARTRASLAQAELVRGDFSVTLPAGPFDVVMAGYNTLFNLPDDAALAECLAHVAAVLADDGRFVVDCVMPPRDGGGDHVGVRSITTDEVVLSVSRHDPATGRIIGQFVHFGATAMSTVMSTVIPQSSSPSSSPSTSPSTGISGPHGQMPGVRLRPWSVRYVSPERLDEIASAQGLALVSRHLDGENGAPSTRHVSVYSRAH